MHDAQDRGKTLGSSLLGAALAGLMGAGLGACGENEKETIVEVSAPKPSISSTSVDKTLTLQSFTSLCEERGGVVQTHASCAGANSCAGLSFHSSSGKLSEHSCRATNICAGMSCVDLPEDKGLSGTAILTGIENGAEVGSEIKCSFCHGSGEEKFILPIAPGTDPQAAIDAFKARSDSALIAKIAFGIHGVSADGVAFANMPGFYQSYSLAETKRLVTHLRALPLETKTWGMAEE